jgi:hypothetical protein
MTDTDQPNKLHCGEHRRAWSWVVMAVILAGAVIQLHCQGRAGWCSCGRLSPWAGDIWSLHCSQHLFDPYSFTHVLHGLVLYGLLAVTCPRMPLAWRFCLAISLEAGWEVFENCDFTIERYRAMTIALDYQGDSIANSVGDILSCGVGFLLARRLGVWGSGGLFVATEIVLLIWIRDSLLLNVLMLAWPIDAIKTWQMVH